MPRLRCHYVDCVYLEKGYCGAPRVEFDPDEGCMTYSQFDEVPEDDDWVIDEGDEAWEEDELELTEDDSFDSDWMIEEEV